MDKDNTNGLDGGGGLRFLSGTCPDPKCQSRLYCMSSYQSIECTGCGQIHAQSALLNVKEETRDMYNKALFAKSLITSCKPEPGTDNVKVHGLSNYLCKLLSHLLSRYGMDKNTGRPKLLMEMGQSEIFNCGILCDRAFHIDQEHLDIAGYGRDRSGAVEYLADTLNVARETNDNHDRLIPIHADGDGHCLVHAVSRALVGRELFWHPLRLNLMQHFKDNLPRYKDLFNNFVDVDEWDDIINECMPNFVPKDGELVGLRNIHIFGLANVLKRPIILLDSLSGINSSGDYSAVFLPALLTPEQCKNKESVLNFPLCIAWSNQGRNHFISLVGVKDKPCPRLPRYMIQNAWGVHESLVDQYMAFDDQGCCQIGGTRVLNENYIQRLVTAMEEVFFETYKVKPALVADVHQYIFRSKGFVGVTLEVETEKTHQLVKKQALVRCLRCSCLTALQEVSPQWLAKGGRLYQMALQEIGELNTNKMYTFTDYQVSCRYNAEKDCLEPDLSETRCVFCQSLDKFRYVRGDGSLEYQEGDVTLEPAGPSSGCSCGFKHYYNGKFYDNRPREIPVPLEWGGKRLMDVVQWWEKESDPQLDSNVYQVANDLVLKYFPGEFGIEILQQKIVRAILLLTASQDRKEPEPCEGDRAGADDPELWNREEATKIIMSGRQRRSIHKEELTKSESERELRKRIETNAPKQQARRTAEVAAAAKKTPVSKAKAATSTAAPAPSTSSTTPKLPYSHPPQNGTPTPPPTPTTPRPATSSKEKKIRVVAAGGHSNTVTLSEDVTYAQLLQVVLEAVKIPAQHQKLRLGFPPKILNPPAPGHEADIVEIAHGDKITVENTAEVHAPLKEPSGSSSFSSPHKPIRGRVDARMPNEEALLNVLSGRHLGGDNLDYSLMALDIMAETMGLDLWEVVQSQPHHFSQGGLYYRQAQRDVGLMPDTHFTFPKFPGKVFVYNAALDRLELCLRDLGHCEVEADVEKKAQELGRTGKVQPHHHHHSVSHHPSSGGAVGTIRQEESGQASFGSSGAISRHAQRAVFEGLGHSLRDPSTDDTMPEDVPLTESIHGAARRLQNFCDPQHNPRSSIAEEPEKMDLEKGGQGTTAAEPKYRRKGPGFSILEPSPPPGLLPMEITETAVHRLFKNMQQVMDMIEGDGSSEDEDDDEEEEGGDAAAQGRALVAAEEAAVDDDDDGVISQDEGMETT